MRRIIAAATIVLLVFVGILVALPSKKAKDDGAASTPASAKSVPSSAAPIKLSGTGQQASNEFALSQGLATFNVVANGSGKTYLSVMLKDAQGNDVEMIASNIDGTFNGSKAVHIKADGQYLLDVHSDGNWTIDIQQ